MTQPVFAVEPFILIQLTRGSEGTGFDVQTYPPVSENTLLETLEALVTMVRSSVTTD